MNDLERIEHIEEKLGFKLNKVNLDDLFTEKSFFAKSIFFFNLADIQNPKYYWKGIRNYSIDENGNITGLALDFCGLFVLENNYLGNFKHLQELRLKNSYQTDYNFLKELTGLTSLDLSSNNLSNVDFLKELTGLTSLNLRFNNLSNVDFLKELTGLTSLNLRHNKLPNYDFLKELTGLTSLDLNYNKLSDVSFLKELRSLTSIILDNNPITNPPRVIIEQGLQYIWKYFDDIKEQGTDYIYEAKVLIIGETETGKTTLFKKLLNNDYLPQKGNEEDKKSTVGINIEPWEFPYTNDNGKTIKANLWDFGGQEIQYTLHQYFLTKKSFYIFLISNRVGDNNTFAKLGG